MAKPHSLLDSVSACGWNAVTFDRFEVERMREAMRREHPEAFLVDSCQRIETYQSAPCSCESALKLTGRKAVQHLAEVAAGLHSVVLGEEQILGQVRNAYTSATGLLRSLADVAVGSARELRHRHQFNSHAGALLDRALKVSDVAPRGRLLVIGTGQLGQLVARRGREIGFETVFLAGRSAPVSSGPWEFLRLDRLSYCPDIDVVAGCLGSAADSLTADELPRVRSLVADLGTPRNFCGDFGVPIVSIADLLADEASRPHAVRRRTALREELSAIVDSRLSHLAGEGAARASALRSAVERTRAAEVQRMLRLRPDADVQAIDTFSRALMNRLFHDASEAARNSESEFSDRLIRLFGAESEPMSDR